VVSDMSQSVAFYRDVLGMQPTYETPHWSQFDVGGVALGLHPVSGDLKVNSEVGVRICFYTDDIEGTLAEITSKGAVVLKKEDQGYGILSEIEDPDGYRIQICQLKR